MMYVSMSFEMSFDTLVWDSVSLVRSLSSSSLVHLAGRYFPSTQTVRIENGSRSGSPSRRAQPAGLAFDQHRSRPLSRCHAGPRPTREDTDGLRACPRRRIGDPNLVDRCVGPDASVRICRTARACARRSDRIRSNTRGRDGSARWRCP
jgi:hypothetical protein